MRYMALRPVNFRWDAEFVARVDAARGLVPRSAFVRAAVERVLPEPEGAGHADGLEFRKHDTGVSVHFGTGEEVAPAPAEPLPRRPSYVRRGVGPIPKG